MIQIPSTDQEWSTLLSSILSQLPAAVLADASSPSQAQSFPSISSHDLAQYIDHTLLNPTATPADLTTLCTEALQHDFRTVCVYPSHISLCLSAFSKQPATSRARTTPGIAAVISFPEGTDASASKAQSAVSAVSAGATELDMVLNYPQLLDGRYSAVYADVRAVRDAVDAMPPPPEPVLVKVILETSQLTPRQTVFASALAVLAGADFVKTSTGFRGRGAELQDVRIMTAVCDVLAGQDVVGGGGEPAAGGERGGKGRERVLGRAKVKASGGIRTAEEALRMIAAGAERIGASKGVQIVSGYESLGRGGGGVETGGQAKENGY